MHVCFCLHPFEPFFLFIIQFSSYPSRSTAQHGTAQQSYSSIRSTNVCHSPAVLLSFLFLSLSINIYLIYAPLPSRCPAMYDTNVLSDFIHFFSAAVSPCTACIPGQHLLRVRGRERETHRRHRYTPWTRNQPQHVWGRFTFYTMRQGRKRRTGRGTDEQTERQRRRQGNKFEKRCYVTCMAVRRLLLTSARNGIPTIERAIR